VLLREYNGVLPSDIDKLTALPGVGRKTANVIRTHIFHLPSIVVDTHVKRISHRWGITKSLDPVKAEYELMELLPKEHWGRYNTQVIAVGRTICTSQRPKCEGCMFSPHCDEYHKAR
jgi:endonuclease-3